MQRQIQLMMLLARTLFAAALLAGASFEQSRKMEFEVASIKPVAPGEGARIGCSGGPGSQDPTRLICGQMSPRLLITIAYGIKAVHVIGPDWLTTPRFEISAIVPDGTAKDQIPV